LESAATISSSGLLLDPQRLVADRVIDVLIKPVHCEVCVDALGVVNGVLGGIRRDTHFHEHLDDFAVELGLFEFVGYWHLLLTRLRARGSKDLEIKRVLLELEVNFKLLRDPVIIHFSCKDGDQHLREGNESDSLGAGCLCLTNPACEVINNRVSEVMLQASLEGDWSTWLALWRHWRS